MRTVKIANLKANLSQYLDYARQGGEVTVFDRNTPVARIVPYTPARGAVADDEQLTALERGGVIARRGDPRATARWAKGWKPPTLPKGAPSLSSTVRAMRNEEAW